MSYEHVTHLKKTTWDSSSTLISETINIPRKSMRGIVFLFGPTSLTDSENSVYPDISGVKLTIEGVPNSAYSQRIPKNRFYRYDETTRFFQIVDDKFALVIDLRTIQDKN